MHINMLHIQPYYTYISCTHDYLYTIILCTNILHKIIILCTQIVIDRIRRQLLSAISTTFEIAGSTDRKVVRNICNVVRPPLSTYRRKRDL